MIKRKRLPHVVAHLLAAMLGLLTARAADPVLTIVCSTTQTADLTRQVVGDRCKVVCILGAVFSRDRV